MTQPVERPRGRIVMSNKLIEALVGASVIAEGDRVRLLDVFRGLQGVEVRHWTSGGDVL